MLFLKKLKFQILKNSKMSVETIIAKGFIFHWTFLIPNTGGFFGLFFFFYQNCLPNVGRDFCFIRNKETMATIAVVCIWLRNQFSIEQSNPGKGLSPNFEKKKPSFLAPREAHCTLNHVWVSQLDGQIIPL